MEFWTEDDLSKLPYKELKVLARKSNINSRSKKADLVKALLSAKTGDSDTNSIEENQTGRFTRSGVSFFQPSNDIQSSSDTTCETSESISTNLKKKGMSQLEENESKGKRGRRNKKMNSEGYFSPDMSKKFAIVSSLQKSSNPLSEITNQNKISETGEPFTAEVKTNRRKRMKSKIDSNTTVSSSLDSNITEPLDEKPSKTETVETFKDESALLSNSSFINIKESKRDTNMTKARSRKIKISKDNCESPKINLNVASTDQGQLENIKEVTRSSPIREEKEQYNNSIEHEIQSIENTNGIGMKSKSNESKKRRQGRKEKDETVLKSEINVDENEISENKLSPKIQSGNCETSSFSCVNRSTMSDTNEIHGTDKSLVINEDPPTPGNSAQTSVPALRRDSTFTFHDSPNKTKTRLSAKRNQFSSPAREATFTIESKGDNKTGLSDKRSRFDSPAREKTFTIDSPKATQPKASTSVALPSVKSIGERILTTAIKSGNVKPPERKTLGSTIKKTITKQAQGSVGKFGSARKAPNFKSIHQRLFKNMESLKDNQERKQERAQVLLLSPVVPRCATVGLKGEHQTTSPKIEMCPTNKAPRTKMVHPSPLRAKLAARTDKAQTPSYTQTKTPRAARATQIIPAQVFPTGQTKTPQAARAMQMKTPRTAPATQTKTSNAVLAPVNRFGFRPDVRRKEATSIIGKELAVINLENKREKQRKELQGVRLNKRFLLQMEMRHGKK